MDPATWGAIIGWVSANAGTIGAVTAVAGTVAAGASAKAQGDAAADAANSNADRMEIQAREAMKQGVSAEEQLRQRNRAALGEQRARMGEDGLSLTTGTSGDIYSQSVQNTELDALQLRYENLLRGESIRIGAMDTRYGGQVAREQGRLDRNASYLSAASMLAGSRGRRNNPYLNYDLSGGTRGSGD